MKIFGWTFLFLECRKTVPGFCLAPPCLIQPDVGMRLCMILIGRVRRRGREGGDGELRGGWRRVKVETEGGQVIPEMVTSISESLFLLDLEASWSSRSRLTELYLMNAGKDELDLVPANGVYWVSTLHFFIPPLLSLSSSLSSPPCTSLISLPSPHPSQISFSPTSGYLQHGRACQDWG
jgi:hypothetical protein